MAETTGIAWCDSTFNPVIGCTKVGPGCDNCYAEAQDSRKRWDGGKTHWGAGVPRYRTSVSNWAQPIAWNKKAEASGKPWRVFCGSLCDVFDNEWPVQVRADLLALICDTQALTWLLLTKRIGNAAKMLKGAVLPNVWLGATVVNQEEADRDIPKLLALPAAKRFVSYEPALGPVDWHMDLTTVAERKRVAAAVAAGSQAEYMAPIGMQLQWIIVGGESKQAGYPSRPFDLAWARSTIEQCKTAGVPCFFKQAGSNPIEQERFHPAHTQGDLSGAELSRRFWQFKDRAGADPAEWPEDLRVQQFPT